MNRRRQPQLSKSKMNLRSQHFPVFVSLEHKVLNQHATVIQQFESKWQEVQGTADEKLCYLVANIRSCYPCPAIVIAGGSGARPGAIKWLRSQVDGVKLYAVFHVEEFVSWCNRNL
jgi:hypothetical protein